MTIDEIKASTAVLRKHDKHAIVHFTPEGGIFTVIFLNTQLSDDHINDIHDELLKMSGIDLSRTSVTDTGVRMLLRSCMLQYIALPQGISGECIQAVLQLPNVRDVRIALASPPPGYEAVVESPDFAYSTALTIRKTPKTTIGHRSSCSQTPFSPTRAGPYSV